MTIHYSAKCDRRAKKYSLQQQSPPFMLWAAMLDFKIKASDVSYALAPLCQHTFILYNLAEGYGKCESIKCSH